MTRRTQFKGNSRSRRRERLKAKALANGVLAREEDNKFRSITPPYSK
ncbi:hypothetical protein ECDEC11C_5437 [Escherichia coli DEC11C]|nr:hypothetical protein ECDEC11C_5437 [Escherichia coli DEC11C]